ncbi:MAG: hypothetical protein JWP59_4291 [Massilia sp.]|jgi:hypothetical protein|nr:hypothetical protein [Massilia sp.]
MRQIFMWSKLACAFVLYTLAGCAGMPAGAPLRDGSYPLTPGGSVAIGGGASVRYDAFTDSRCPKGAQCIWAGKVSYQFVLSSPAGTEPFALDYQGQRYDAKTMPKLHFEISFAGVSALPVEQHAVVLEVRSAP